MRGRGRGRGGGRREEQINCWHVNVVRFIVSIAPEEVAPNSNNGRWGRRRRNEGGDGLTPSQKERVQEGSLREEKITNILLNNLTVACWQRIDNLALLIYVEQVQERRGHACRGKGLDGGVREGVLIEGREKGRGVCVCNFLLKL